MTVTGEAGRFRVPPKLLPRHRGHLRPTVPPLGPLRSRDSMVRAVVKRQSGGPIEFLSEAVIQDPPCPGARPRGRRPRMCAR